MHAMNQHIPYDVAIQLFLRQSRAALRQMQRIITSLRATYAKNTNLPHHRNRIRCDRSFSERLIQFRSPVSYSGITDEDTMTQCGIHSNTTDRKKTNV